MTSRVEPLVAGRDAASPLERGPAAPRRWRHRLDRHRVWFDARLRARHRRLKQSLPTYIREGSLQNLLTAPVIYSLALPFAVLDLWVTLYQWVCFPLYGIARVRRRRYFTLDRHKLAYLNGIEKLNCTYCSYVNGLVAYVREVAARTEQYWCPIKHARAVPGAHQRYRAFLDYGDALAYRRKLPALRHALKARPRRRSGSRAPRHGHGR